MTSRVCRALSAFALFVGAVSLLPGSAHADTARAESKSLEIGISEVSPQVPNFTNFDKKMTFSGKILNTGTTPLKDIHLELWRSLVNNRSDLGSADGSGFPPNGVKSVKITELAPGAAQTWSFTPSETDLFGSHNPVPGVYAIDIDAFNSDDTFLGGQRTYTMWKPKQGAGQSQLALMWPVVGQPGLTGQKKPDNAALPILPDQSTAQQFALTGRLNRILQDASGIPVVNYLVDPDVLYTAEQLAGGYFYTDTDGKQVGAQGNGDAKRWYDLATAQLGQSQNCFNLLYGDPDLNSLSRTDAGKDVLKAAAGVKAAVTTGGCRQDGPTIAWPSDGQADATTLGAIADTKLSNPVSLVASKQVSGWPSAHVSLPNSPSTVAYDSYLSSVFAGPAQSQTPQNPLNNADVLAGQMWLAQTALADHETNGRVLVVTPPRDFDPGPQLLNAVKAMSAVPYSDQWYGLDDLGKVLNVPATPERTSALTKISTPNLAENVVYAASDSQQLYHALRAIMPPDHQSDEAVPFRPVATWWRDHGGDAVYSKSVYDTAVADHALVSFGAQTPPLTMSGKSGTVPVTINNKTNTPIRVFLGAHSAHTVDLKVEQNQGAHTVSPDQSATVRIPVQGEGNGPQINLTAKLYTCPGVTEDCSYNPPNLHTRLTTDVSSTTVQVKVSRIGIIALGLIIGSGFLLVLLIGLRVYRAKRAHHAPVQDTMAS